MKAEPPGPSAGPVPPRRAGRPKIGLALAGGGPEGAIYEIGALRALEESLEGADLEDFDVYVGVSAGSFVAACLANGITPKEMCYGLLSPHHGRHFFMPGNFLTPAFREMAHRALMTPRLTAEAVWDYLWHSEDLTLLDSMTRLGRALPVGLFDNEPIRQYLEQLFDFSDRSDDFRCLARRLVVVASDLDSGEAVCFGQPGFDHVAISRAVQASTALPGLYPPVEIGGRYYVDGVLLKTLHASVALEAGVDLLLCVNPIVPVDTADAVERGVMRRGRLVHRGLPTVLSQTFRTLVHSRLTVGMSSYEPRFPGTDVVLVEPRRDDYRMFFTNVFRFSSRRAVCEHAFAATRRDLWNRREELAPKLARHGIRLRTELLADPDRDLWESIHETREVGSAAERLDRALLRLERLLDDMPRRAASVT